MVQKPADWHIAPTLRGLRGGSAHGATITVTGSFEVSSPGNSANGSIVLGDSFNFTLVIDGSVAGIEPTNPAPFSSFEFENFVTSLTISRDPGNVGFYDPGSFTLISSTAVAGGNENADAIFMRIALGGMAPISDDDEVAGFFLQLGALSGAVFDTTQPENTTLEDFWRFPTTLADYPYQNVGAFLGPDFTSSEAVGLISAVTVVPEPGLATMLVGAGVLGVFIRRRRSQRK